MKNRLPMTAVKRAALIGLAFALNLICTVTAIQVIQPARALVGVPPGTGFQLVDGSWLAGIVNGQNFNAQNGITAKAGGTQALATLLTPGAFLYEVDTVATTGDSVALPECVQGTAFMLRNAGAGTLDVYGNPTTNQLTNALDTINGTAGTSAFTIATQVNTIFFCAKNGAWSALQ